MRAEHVSTGRIPLDARPLTEAQEGLWFFQALDPANPILNTGQYLDLRGPIDRSALLAAVEATIAGTEALHLRIGSGKDGPVQWLQPGAVRPAVVDLTGDPAGFDKANAMMRADGDRALDLARDPLAAFTLFWLGPDRALVYERIHHLATDGYGMVLITNRIGAHYAHLTGSDPDVNPAPRPFPPLSRAAEDDAGYRASDRRAGDRDWWLATLAGLPAEVGGPAPGRANSGHRFIRDSRVLDAELAAALQARSQATGIGWPDLLAALTGAYLARWTGDGRAVIGLPFMARMGRRAAGVPCTVMNVLPQLIAPDDARPLDDWLAEVAAQMREGRAHGLYRSEYLRRELGRVGGDRRLHGPLVNVQPFDHPPVFPGLRVGLHILGAGAVDDLTLTFRGDPASGILFEADANPDLYSPDEVAGHAARLADFLARSLKAEALAGVATASRAEINAIETIAQAAVRPVPDTTLTALLTAQMAHTPDAIALRFGDATLDYAGLDRRSAALAEALRDRGAGPERIVAVAMHRALELPVALVAILRAGAAYLPMDPDHPPARIAGILADAQPVAVLTTADLAGLFPADAPLFTVDEWPTDTDADALLAPAPEPKPDNMAYVIFTSGSTGEPKGVVIDHRAIANRLLWMAEVYGIDASDRILQKTPVTFDVSVWEFFLPLITGGQLVISPPEAHKHPARLALEIRRHAITTLHFVPSMLSAFLAAPASEGMRLRRVFVSGEAMSAELRDRFHDRMRAQLHNLYGPTEAAVDVSHWDAGPQDRSDPVPIGWPVWNTRLEVMDHALRPQPPGLAGDLYLGGVQLARGYLNRPDLTAARFIPDPRRPGQRLYATGDLAKVRPDGATLFLGRSDHQVKLRGLRIELGEIEAAIMATGLAREVVVIAREDHPGQQRLVAYLVPAKGYAPGLIAPRLGRTLPEYMIPTVEVALPNLPVTVNGKLDRAALKVPDIPLDGRAAASPTEALLADLFADILGLSAPAPADGDFFALGGDSLSAVRLLMLVEEAFGHDPGLGTLFQHPRVANLARLIDTQSTGNDGLGPTILLAEGDTSAAPLFLIHPAGGLAWGYRHLARLIAPGCAIWGIQHPGLDPEATLPASIADLARDYRTRMRRVAPDGPLNVAGWSLGGIIAQEVAVQEAEAGGAVGLTAALDAYPADAWREQADPDPVTALRALLAVAGHDPEAQSDLDSREKVLAFLRRDDSALAALPARVLDGVIRIVTDTNRLIRAHHHRRLPGTLTHIRAGRDHTGKPLSAAMWQPHAERVEALEVPFLHAQMTGPEASALIAPLLQARLG